MADNKMILEKANQCIQNGDNEGFLAYCTENTEWTFVGDMILKGKDEVRKYMAETYLEPPKFSVENLIAEGNYVTAIGKISLKDKEGNMNHYTYCDVWKFQDGLMKELKAFVIKA